MRALLPRIALAGGRDAVTLLVLLAAGCDTAFGLVEIPVGDVTRPDAAAPDVMHADGLVAHFPFDAISGDVTLDLVSAIEARCKSGECPASPRDASARHSCSTV